MKITLKQLAHEAGVSPATVSLALNGSGSVAEKTRLRIQELARRLNYQPNFVARSLAGGNNQLIGVLIDSRAPRVQFRMLALIEREAANHGYKIMIGEAHDNVGHLREIHDTFRQYGAKGTICLAHDYPGQEEEFRRTFEGCSNILYVGKPRLNHASYVDIDRSEAVRAAVRHLHGQGFQKIGMVCSALDYCSVLDRLRGFRDIHEELGDREFSSRIFRVDNASPETLCAAICRNQIRRGKCDALLLENDAQAAFICKMLQRTGIHVPEEFGVIGSDNDDICRLCTPELSSIDDAQDLQAHHAVRMLLDILNDKSSDRIDRSLTVKSRLVIRESSLRSQPDAEYALEKNLA